MGIFFPILRFSLYLCTMKLHIFNPEHDLALAANLKQFTAPHAGRQLRSDLAFIPALWAEEGDLVLVDDIDFAKNRVRHFGAELNSKVEFIARASAEASAQDGISGQCSSLGMEPVAER